MSTYRYLELDTQGISIRARATNDGSRFGSSNASRKVQVHARVSVRMRHAFMYVGGASCEIFVFFLDSDSLYLQLGWIEALHAPAWYVHVHCHATRPAGCSSGGGSYGFLLLFFWSRMWFGGAKCYFCTFLCFLHFLVMVRITILASFAYKIHTFHQAVMKSDR
ncbi:hypothetical protein V8C40DRAFT_130169 [Trichoderma camerunense]